MARKSSSHLQHDDINKLKKKINMYFILFFNLQIKKSPEKFRAF